jgi:protein TonB
MLIIITLIAIVLLISLYDFFSAKNWQQVTSEVRNETVFKNRNKNYGAYVMRRDYNKRMLLILSGMVVSMGAAYGTFMVVKSTPKVAIEVPTTEFDTISLLIEPEKDEPEILKIEKIETPASPEKMNEFRELVVSDTPEKDPQLVIDPDVRSGDKKVLGDGEEHFTPPFDTTGTGRKNIQKEI